MNESPSQIYFVQAHKLPGIDARLERVIPWIRDSDRAYYDRLLADCCVDTTLARWARNRDSEIALHKIRLMIADGHIAGGFVAVSGRQLARRREADLIDLARQAGALVSPNLRRRIQAVYPLIGAVAHNDLYLSKLGTTADFSGRGYEELLLDECIKRAETVGFSRLRIDVDRDDPIIPDLCAENGFDLFDRGVTPDGQVTYLNLVREL